MVQSRRDHSTSTRHNHVVSRVAVQHSPSSPAHKSPYASCSPTRITHSPPVLWSTQLPTLPPFPAHSGMRRNAAPASSSPSCAHFFLFSSFCFLFLFHFTLPFSHRYTGIPFHVQTRGVAKQPRLRSRPCLLSNPARGTAAVAFPSSRRPRHARRSHRPPVHCPIMGFGLVSELSTSFPTSR